MLLVALLTGNLAFSGLKGAPWWQLTGGLIGATFVYLTVVVVPELGAGGLLAALVAGQLAGGLAIDHFGLFGLQAVSISAPRVIGLVLLVLGAALIIHE